MQKTVAETKRHPWAGERGKSWGMKLLILSTIGVLTACASGPPTSPVAAQTLSAVTQTAATVAAVAVATAVQTVPNLGAAVAVGQTVPSAAALGAAATSGVANLTQGVAAASAAIQSIPNLTAPAPGLAIAGIPGASLAKAEVTFVDLDIFDREMVSALITGASEVEVAIVTAMSLNQISPRLGRWLNTVQESGGRVQILGAQRTRSVLLMSALGQMAYSSWQETKLRGLLKGVDAELTVADQKIERVVFRRRASS